MNSLSHVKSVFHACNMRISQDLVNMSVCPGKSCYGDFENIAGSGSQMLTGSTIMLLQSHQANVLMKVFEFSRLK